MVFLLMFFLAMSVGCLLVALPLCAMAGLADDALETER